MRRIIKKFKEWSKPQKTAVFFGTLYDLKRNPDPDQRFCSTGARKGRKSLIADVAEKVSPKQILEFYRACKNDTNPNRFLAMCESAGVSDDIAVRYFSHYDRCTTKFFKRLCIRHHIKTREAGCDFILWRGNEYQLTDVETQRSLFEFMLESFPDPTCLRLALAPQYWHRYLDTDFDSMMKIIGYKYRSMLNGSRKNPIIWKVFFKSLYKAIQEFEDTTLKRYLFLALKYSMFMYREYGVQMELPKMFVKNGSEFNAKIFRSKYFTKFLYNWSYSRLSNGLKFGLVTNPWVVFDEIFEQGMIDDGRLIFRKYSFLEDIDSIVEHFHVERIWDEEEK